jgi:voltage-gated potassium channel
MDNELIAIFGYNSFSFELIAQLSAKQHNLIILDNDPEKIEHAEQKGLPAQLMNYHQDDELLALGIGSRVVTLFCFLEKDSENVFLTLSARALDQQLKIISIVNHPDSAEKLLAAGANKIIDPYEICSNKVYQLLTPDWHLIPLKYRLHRAYDLVHLKKSITCLLVLYRLRQLKIS